MGLSPGGWPIDTAASAAVVCGFVAVSQAALWAGSRHRRLAVKIAAGAMAFALTIVPVAAVANTYYAYVPTVAGLLGRRATLQMRHRDVVAVTGGFGRAAAGRHGRGHSVLTGGLAAGTEAALAAGDAAAPAVGGGGDVAVRRRGGVDSVDIPGTVSGFRARPAEVYLPPIWFSRRRPALPVVMLLHGSPGEPADWTRGGMADVTTEAWAQRHGGVAPIVVMPDPNGDRFADSQCVDGAAGRAETYLTVDVVRFVISTYGARPERDSWAVGGLSEGGTCSVRLALRHPDRFAAFLAFGSDARTSGATLRRVLGGMPAPSAVAQYSPLALIAGARAMGVSGYVCAGTGEADDAAAARSLYARGIGAGADVTLSLQPGGHHTFRVWRDCFEGGLAWVAARLVVGPAAQAPAAAVS